MGQCREIRCEDIAATVARLCVQACTLLPEPVRELLEGACETEPFPPARETLQLICHNADVARERRMPICQDTGMAVVYAELGQDAHICGGLLEGPLITLTVRGNAFLYNMVRIIAGTLVDIGTGRLSPDAFARALNGGSRLDLGATAPACGLELTSVEYDNDPGQAGILSHQNEM